MGPPGLESLPDRPRRRRGLDRVIGILLGIVLGVGIVTAFVFLGSEGTIDAPRISGEGATGTGGAGERQRQRQTSEIRRQRQRQRGEGPAAPPVVTVIGGAPPQSGPARLDFKQGQRVRFRIRTDSPVGIEIPGYGISETINSDAVVTFRARRPGQFPVVVAASHIGIASLRIER